MLPTRTYHFIWLKCPLGLEAGLLLGFRKIDIIESLLFHPLQAAQEGLHLLGDQKVRGSIACTRLDHKAEF